MKISVRLVVKTIWSRIRGKSQEFSTVTVVSHCLTFFYVYFSWTAVRGITAKWSSETFVAVFRKAFQSMDCVLCYLVPFFVFFVSPLHFLYLPYLECILRFAVFFAWDMFNFSISVLSICVWIAASAGGFHNCVCFTSAGMLPAEAPCRSVPMMVPRRI